MNKIWWMGAGGMGGMVMALVVMVMTGTIDVETVVIGKVVVVGAVGAEGTGTLMVIIMELEVVTVVAEIRMGMTAKTDAVG